jgi:hypothetical protein
MAILALFPLDNLDSKRENFELGNARNSKGLQFFSLRRVSKLNSQYAISPSRRRVKCLNHRLIAEIDVHSTLAAGPPDRLDSLTRSFFLPIRPIRSAAIKNRSRVSILSTPCPLQRHSPAPHAFKPTTILQSPINVLFLRNAQEIVRAIQSSNERGSPVTFMVCGHSSHSRAWGALSPIVRVSAD